MEIKLINKKKALVVALSSFMTFSTVISPGTAYASTLNSEVTSNAVQDENGQDLVLEKNINNGVHTSVVKDVNGKVVSSFILDTNEGTAYLDGEPLSEMQIAELMAFVENLDIHNDSTFLKDFQNQKNLDNNMSTQSVSVWHYSGTNEGSLWLAQTSIVAAAGIIASLVPGIGWIVALNIAGALVGQADTPYYRMNIYYGYTPGYIHVKRDIVFYKNSSRSSILYGPVTAIQKKSTLY